MINPQKFNYVLQNEKYYYNITINSDHRILIDLYECNITCEKDNIIIKDPWKYDQLFMNQKRNKSHKIISSFENRNSTIDLHTFILKSISKEFKQQRKSK